MHRLKLNKNHAKITRVRRFHLHQHYVREQCDELSWRDGSLVVKHPVSNLNNVIVRLHERLGVLYSFRLPHHSVQLVEPVRERCDNVQPILLSRNPDPE